jgi:hypothetical protein
MESTQLGTKVDLVELENVALAAYYHFAWLCKHGSLTKAEEVHVEALRKALKIKES